VTDWRRFDKEARGSFQKVLNKLSQVELQVLAMTLYEKDSNNKLSGDGLERGAIALEFILITMGCKKQRETKWGDLTELGELLQIVDDVLDREDDLAAGEQNCLLTEKKAVYITRLLEGLSRENSSRLFGHSILGTAIAHARRKATLLLESSPER
jgi:hypothetical protein